MDSRTILCYGDSNTWGFDVEKQDRLPPGERWPGVLAQELGPSYRVIEEGLGGRTTVWDDPIEGYKNGKEYLIPCLATHAPIDLVALMLGTNDLKRRFSVSAYDIAQSAGVLLDVIAKSQAGPKAGAPAALLIAPPVVGKLTGYAEMFGGDAVERSKLFGRHYRQVAELFKAHFLDAAQVIVSSDLDGIHFDAGEHRKLGQAVAARVKEIFA